MGQAGRWGRLSPGPIYGWRRPRGKQSNPWSTAALNDELFRDHYTTMLRPQSRPDGQSPAVCTAPASVHRCANNDIKLPASFSCHKQPFLFLQGTLICHIPPCEDGNTGPSDTTPASTARTRLIPCEGTPMLPSLCCMASPPLVAPLGASGPPSSASLPHVHVLLVLPSAQGPIVSSSRRLPECQVNAANCDWRDLTQGRTTNRAISPYRYVPYTPYPRRAHACQAVLCGSPP